MKFEAPSSTESEASMEIEKTVLSPSDRYQMNNEESKPAAAAAAVSEGDSESGDDLFPTTDLKAAWPLEEASDPAVRPAPEGSTPAHPTDADVVLRAERPSEAPAPEATDPAEGADGGSGGEAATRAKRKRATGLGNLGNTCFMNSTLQCLAHTAPLAEYFLSGEYKQHLNRDNPLGTGGELAREFASLLGQMWCLEGGDADANATANATGVYSSSRIYSPGNGGNYDTFPTVTYPRSFKHTLGKYAEQFVGYDQHDSQELAIYLLDALHEDTNRVTKKPYIEKPEQEEDESDDVAAEKAWGVHLQREDSRVFEYFMGQIKSRLQCTTKGCGRVSTTFDPSMYLSVPIPGSMDREMKVTFVPLDHSLTCAELTVKLCKNSTVTGLRKHVAELARECYGFEEGELMEEDIQFADIFNDKVYAYYAEDHHIDKIKDSDVTFAYQLFPLESVKREFAAYQEEQKKSAVDDAGATEDDEPIDFLLDYESRNKLDEEGEWQKALEKYVPYPISSVVRLLNEKRSNLNERMVFYDKVIRFVAKCRKCSDCRLVDDAIMEEKSDKAEPLSVLNPNEADSSDVETSLAEVCEMTRSFCNVKSARDVAILEYCAFKFKTFANNLEQASKAVELNENGFIIQVALNKNGKRTGKPIVVRIPSTLTVSEFRKTLASQISHILKVDNDVAGHSAHETSVGGMSAQSSIMMQMALTHEPRGRYNSTNPEAFGSITEEHLTEGTPAFAKSSEDAEKQLVASFITDLESTIVLKVPSRLDNVVNEDALSISEAYLSEAQKIEKAKLLDNKVSVMDCIKKFCQAEQLDENDMWYCNKCKQHNQAWKECHLYRTPPILVIHLKRFHFSATTHRRDKIDTLIDFPLNDLDLRELVTHWSVGEEPIYDCYAVSNHFGGLGGGHYTAYARGDDGSWSNFDDSRVTPGVDESEVVSSAAYCLYYKRKDVVFNANKGLEEMAQAMVTETPEFKPAPILTDDASSQAQMDVDDRSSNLSLSSAHIDQKNWEDDNMNDDNGLPQLINAEQEYNYPLQ